MFQCGSVLPLFQQLSELRPWNHTYERSYGCTSAHTNTQGKGNDTAEIGVPGELFLSKTACTTVMTSKLVLIG